MHQKSYYQNVTEICTFFTFTHVRQTCFAQNFLWCIFPKTFFKVILVLFSNFEAKRAKKRLKKSKNVFSKCVLDFNFAHIKRSIFFIFQKNSNSLYPNVQIRSTRKGKKWKTVFVSRLKEINCPPGNKWFLDHYNKRHP